EVVVVGDELAKPIHGPGAGGDGVGQGDVTAAGVLVPAAQDLGDGEGDAVVVVAGGARLGGLDTADRHRQGQAGLEVDGALVAHGAEGVLHERVGHRAQHGGVVLAATEGAHPAVPGERPEALTVLHGAEVLPQLLGAGDLGGEGRVSGDLG